MKKIGLFLPLAIIIVLGSFFVFRSTPVQTIAPSPTPVVSPSINSEEIPLKQAIKVAIITKHNVPPDSFVVSIRKIEGDYAQGSADPPTPGPGGGMWFAAKVNRQWQLVWDGNGIISCADLKSYPNFPADLVPACFDQTSGQLVKR